MNHRCLHGQLSLHCIALYDRIHCHRIPMLL